MSRSSAVKNHRIKREQEGPIHLDGEPRIMGADIKVKIYHQH
jgi:hypothetical protein